MPFTVLVSDVNLHPYTKDLIKKLMEPDLEKRLLTKVNKIGFGHIVPP